MYGVRPPRRVIQRQVQKLDVGKVLAGEFAEGDSVLVDHAADGYPFAKTASEVVAALAPKPNPSPDNAGERFLALDVRADLRVFRR